MPGYACQGTKVRALTEGKGGYKCNVCAEREYYVAIKSVLVARVLLLVSPSTQRR